MKARRQAEILAIIQEYDIETQDQLLEKLREKGLKSTQATISRDIKELHLVKELTGHSTYKYTVSERKTSLNVAGRLNNIFRESVTSFDSAQNIVVLKTMPGLASADAPAQHGGQPGRGRHRPAHHAHHPGRGEPLPGHREDAGEERLTTGKGKDHALAAPH